MLFLSVSLGLPFSQVRAMSSAELSLYMAYYRVDPWGEERADLRNAMGMSQTANLHRDTKKRPEPFGIDDFMPFRKKPEPDADELREKVSGVFQKLAALQKRN